MWPKGCTNILETIILAKGDNQIFLWLSFNIILLGLKVLIMQGLRSHRTVPLPQAYASMHRTCGTAAAPAKLLDKQIQVRPECVAPITTLENGDQKI